MAGGMGLRIEAYTRRACMSMTSFTADTKSATGAVGATAAAAEVVLQSVPWIRSERAMASARREGSTASRRDCV